MLRCITCDCRQSEKFIIKNFLYKGMVISFPIEFKDGKLVEQEIIINGEVICDNVKNVWPLLLDEKVRVYCPCCNESYFIHSLIDGYNNPMPIFETADLCSCGGEICEEMIHASSSPEFSQEWKGDQRKVSCNIKIAKKCERCGKPY